MKIIIYNEHYYFTYDLENMDMSNGDYFIGEYESLEDYMREENVIDFEYQKLNDSDISEKNDTHGILIRHIIYNSKRFKNHLNKKLRIIKIKTLNDKKK